MIEVILIGGLGNCFFQYAAGRALALRHGTSLVLNTNRVLRKDSVTEHLGIDLLPSCDLKARITSSSYAMRMLSARWRIGGRTRFSESAWGYDPEFESLGARTILFGYFQSERYWQGLEASIRAELMPSRLADDPTIRGWANEIERRASAVSIHVRRGDYLGSSLHNVCTPAYYLRAIDMMRANVKAPRFFVFSDDLNWCRDMFRSDDFVFVDTTQDRRSALLDIYLMSRCTHHIVTNSTFSWWGAWLGERKDKVVMVPDRWFNDPVMDRHAMRDTVPAAWRRVSFAG